MSQQQILFKYGVYEIVQAMIEAEGFLRPPPLIDHRALGYEGIGEAYNEVSKIFNKDIRFRRAVKLKNGRSWTSLDFQLYYFSEARRFFAEGRGTLTPERKAVLHLWGITLKALKRWDLPFLATYLDWAAILYYEVIPRLKRIDLDPELLFAPPNFPNQTETPTTGISYDHPLKRKDKSETLLDYLLYFIVSYANVDTSASPYGLYLRKGLMQQIFTPEEIQFAKNNPPQKTRARLREEIIRNPPANQNLESWNWHYLSFAGPGLPPPKTFFDLPNPYRHTIKPQKGLTEFIRHPPPPSSMETIPSTPEHGGS